MYRLQVFLILLSFSSCTCAQDSYKEERAKMVENQLIARGIRSPEVVSAMRKVERHRFVPEHLKNQAYRDGPLPIGYGQTISQPYVVAYMTEILELKPADKVLEVGTGSGYQAAILAEICDSVFSVEVIPELGQQAIRRLESLGYANILVKIGDGYRGWIEHAPFDAIIVTCAPGRIPEPLTQQLREGGSLIIPVGERYVQELVLLKKKQGKIVKKSVLSVLFVPMVNEWGMPY
ncbi:MAG: protein-L-isoaspartate(D-aspartate) O-methyltransferase [Bacteroidales bacterium]|nr:protein-L-isoaspartate(D-aspartate) O-methyltransferase [Bacteroidales bacterium]